MAAGLLSILLAGKPNQNFVDFAYHDSILPLIDQKPQSNVVIVAIDEATLATWPEPMAFWGDRFARIVDNCARQGAKSIVFDSIPSTNADAFLDAINAPSSYRPNTELGLMFARHPERTILVQRPEGTSASSPSQEVLLDPEIVQNMASADLTYAVDGRVRMHHPATGSVPTVAARLVAKLGTNSPQEPVFLSFPSESWPRYSAREAAEPGASLPAVKDAVVFIGADSEELGDIHMAGGGKTLSGVEMHAHAFSSLMEGRYWLDSNAANMVLLCIALFSSSSVLLPRGRPLILAFATPIAFLILGLGAAKWLGVLLPGGTLALASVVASETAWIGRSMQEMRDKRQITQLFGVHVSPSVRDYLLAANESWSGKTEVATVLFLDIRGSTTMAEKMAPSFVFSDLNEFFEVSIRAIENRGGLVNRFLGDGYLALFGVPKPLANHADTAVQAALETLEDLKAWNDAREDRNLPRIECGIGVHTGPLCHGLIGSSKRREYTVVGDTVNTASRLQDLTKVLGSHLVVSAQTMSMLEAVPNLTKQEGIMLKGRTESIEVYSWSAML